MKSMLRYLLFALPGLLFCYSCSNKPAKVEAFRSESWDEIDAYVKRSWPEYLEKDPVMPAPYLYGLNPGTLYYWDIYFHNEGLIRHGYWDMVRDGLDCMIFQIDSLGFIPNALHWGADRSQSPLFSLSVRRFWETSPEKDTVWLEKAYRAVLKEYDFWTNENGNRIEDHSTSVAGLQRYGQHSDTASLISFYDRVLKGRFRLPDGATREEKVVMAAHRLAEAETMDFTPRFEGRCMDFIPVDLNSYLYGYEKDLAFYEHILGIYDGRDWEKKAAARAALIDRYCWNAERGLYLDYDFVNKRFSPIASIVTVLPMFFEYAPDSHARRISDNLPLFDSDGGLVVCEVTPQDIVYQWGDAAVWAPIQHFGMEAMTRYGYRRQAYNIAMKWLNTVTRNWVDPQPATYPPFKYGDGNRHPGFLYEKYTRDGLINDAEYPCSHMLGWTASTFLVALEIVRENK